MNVLDATRAWLREECPLINRHNKFNANYIGAEATEYTLRSAGESHTLFPTQVGVIPAAAASGCDPRKKASAEKGNDHETRRRKEADPQHHR